MLRLKTIKKAVWMISWLKIWNSIPRSCLAALFDCGKDFYFSNSGRQLSTQDSFFLWLNWSLVGEQGTLGARVSFVLDQILKRFMGGILPLCWQGLGQLAGVNCQTVKGPESETGLHHVAQRKCCNKGIEGTCPDLLSLRLSPGGWEGGPDSLKVSPVNSTKSSACQIISYYL